MVAAARRSGDAALAERVREAQLAQRTELGLLQDRWLHSSDRPDVARAVEDFEACARAGPGGGRGG